MTNFDITNYHWQLKHQIQISMKYVFEQIYVIHHVTLDSFV